MTRWSIVGTGIFRESTNAYASKFDLAVVGNRGSSGAHCAPLHKFCDVERSFSLEQGVVGQAVWHAGGYPQGVGIILLQRGSPRTIDSPCAGC